MSTIQITLSEEQAAFVQEQAAKAGLQNAEEYFLKLVQDERMRMAQERLEELLMEGLNDPVRIEVTKEWWKKLENELEEEYRESQ